MNSDQAWSFPKIINALLPTFSKETKIYIENVATKQIFFSISSFNNNFKFTKEDRSIHKDISSQIVLMMFIDGDYWFFLKTSFIMLFNKLVLSDGSAQSIKISLATLVYFPPKLIRYFNNSIIKNSQIIYIKDIFSLQMRYYLTQIIFDIFDKFMRKR